MLDPHQAIQVCLHRAERVLHEQGHWEPAVLEMRGFVYMISKSPFSTNTANSSRKCLVGEALRNARTYYHWNGEIACLTDMETHAVQQKLE